MRDIEKEIDNAMRRYRLEWARYHIREFILRSDARLAERDPCVLKRSIYIAEQVARQKDCSAPDSM